MINNTWHRFFTARNHSTRICKRGNLALVQFAKMYALTLDYVSLEEGIRYSVTQSRPTLCNPMNCSTPGFSVLHHLPEFAQTHVHWVSDAIQPSHPLLCLLLLPSVFASIRIFSNESVLRIRWPKYWRVSFSISPSNEYSGLISFRISFRISLLSKEIKPGGDALCICTYFCFAIRLSDVLGTT